MSQFYIAEKLWSLATIDPVVTVLRL